MGLGWVALLGAGLAACGSSSTKTKDGGDAGSDRGSDTREGGGSDATAPDLTGEGGGGDATADSADSGAPDLPVDNTPPDTNVPDTGPPMCVGVAPISPQVTDFNLNGGTSPRIFGSFQPDEKLSGGTYAFPGGAITEDFSGDSWHVSGTITQVSGFGIYWTCAVPAGALGCTLDASQFKGVRFKIRAGGVVDGGVVTNGNAGPDGALTLTLGRSENDRPNQNGQLCGTCTADACIGPRVSVPVAADGHEVTVDVLWTDFHGGSPNDSIDPHIITGFLFLFRPPPDPNAPDGGGDGGVDGATGDAAVNPDGDGDGGRDGLLPIPPYQGEITVDDIEFIPF